APLRRCTPRAGSAAPTCVGIRTSSSGCSSTRARSTSACSCGRRSGGARREGGKACSPPTRSKSPSACSSTACGRLGSASGASRHRYRSYCAPVRLPDALAAFREFHHGLLGLLEGPEPATVAFTHDLIRQAALATLTRAERLDLHGRAATALRGSLPAEMLRRTHHALAAAPRSPVD